MGMINAAQIDQAMSWETFESWRNVVKGATYSTPFGPIVVHEREGRCDHETCYETHGTRLVFSLGDRYFLKEGTYDSQDGYQWTKPLREVKPVEKTVQDWDEVPEIVWNLEQINKFLNQYIKDQPSTRFSDWDWTSLWYAAHHLPDGLDIPFFPWPVRAVEIFENHEPESNGPVWLIFEINGLSYAAKGRNLSHVGWDFDSCYGLEPVEKKTVTKEVWL